MPSRDDLIRRVQTTLAAVDAEIRKREAGLGRLEERLRIETGKRLASLKEAQFTLRSRLAELEQASGTAWRTLVEDVEVALEAVTKRARVLMEAPTGEEGETADEVEEGVRQRRASQGRRR